ncbi:MAG TPA: hypothetical protein VMW75_27325, partial [Thermoanaerobaculia bacterium]|nr:hypothetical protein [Thermoanaerobaculia bacterium]
MNGKQLLIVAGLLVISLSCLLAVSRQPTPKGVEIVTAIGLALLVAAVAEAIHLFFKAIDGPPPWYTFPEMGMLRVAK